MMSGPRRFALIGAALFVVVTPADAQVGAALPVDKLLPPDFSLDSPAGLDRAYYFGGDNHTLPGELERYIDPTYCDAPDPVQPASSGGLTITVRAASDAERAACRLKASERFVSGLLTTRHTFSATYGYWEMSASLPAATRTWPAFWLLPTAKTAVNKGALPEIDIMEEYAGVRQGKSGRKTWTQDRTGYPISTIHPLGAGGAMSCGQTVLVQPGTWHTYGVLWEPTQLTFYVDEIATCVETIAISDPHYLLIDLAMDGRDYAPGPDSPEDYPATMSVRWVRHRPLRAPPVEDPAPMGGPNSGR
jgi:beta-glucanase (GH16 family)